MDFFNYIMGVVDSLIKNQAMSRAAIIMLMGISSFIFFLAILLLINWVYSPVRERLRALGPDQSSGRSAKQSINRVLEASAGVVLPEEGKSRTRFETMLIQAGYRNPNDIMVFYGIRFLTVILLPLLVLFLGGMVIKAPPVTVGLFTIGAAIAGMVGPALVLERMVGRRQKSLRRGLPDALDLLVVCSEAGLGLKAGLQRVSDDIYISYPELAGELAMVNTQTRVGVDSAVALKDLAERTGLEDIRGLVSTLSQSMRFGTSLAESLRIYSDEMRDKRTQRAEERAATLSTKLLFPLIFCVFPSFFVVALGPPMLGALAAIQATGVK
ncbi:MAG: type II secretion system F family protein [Gammaproteobacteria bacterium]|nr:MAG: type II secretion system F family protein [Gammaproteobacteria bacterium]RLA51556.1 MAG: type II secretion system F family protein [Gammaproteobacteria bacterium]